MAVQFGTGRVFGTGRSTLAGAGSISVFQPQQQHDYAYLIRPMVLEVLTAYHIHDMVQMDERLNKKINVAVFTDMEQAQQWLFTSTGKSASPI